jgi:hypothetical protein
MRDVCVRLFQNITCFTMLPHRTLLLKLFPYVQGQSFALPADLITSFKIE